MTVNILMFVLNLIPIPPLDGGRILTSLLPNRYAVKFAQIERYGFFIVLGLMALGLLNYWFVPMRALTTIALKLLTSPLTLLLS